MSGNKTVEDMFQLRDEEYEKHMEGIKEYLKPTLEGLAELFNLTDERQEGTFAWEIFELTKETKELLIVGTVKYQPGDVLVFGNQPIEVTEQNAPMLERIFRFVVPIQLANKQSKVETVKHMEKVIAENETDAAQAQQIQSGFHNPDPEFLTPEFDLDGLTAEQKEALFLSTGFKN
jgi:hypothetical protein